MGRRVFFRFESRIGPVYSELQRCFCGERSLRVVRVSGGPIRAPGEEHGRTREEEELEGTAVGLQRNALLCMPAAPRPCRPAVL